MHPNRLACLAAMWWLCVSAPAATNIIDFNTDPALSDLYAWYGNITDVNNDNAPWRSKGGASGGANDGYLAVTDARGSLHSALVFKDLENGLIIKSFSFDCDLRIGGGTHPAADGFAISLVSETDPAVVASDGGTDPTSTFETSDSETGLPEEGSQTGLSVGFDQWQGGTFYGGTVQDVPGMSIRVDGQLIAQLPLPLRAGNVYFSNMPLPGQQGTNYVSDTGGGNGAASPEMDLATNNVNYAQSLQTGARNLEDTLSNGDIVANDAQPAFGDPEFDLWMKHLRWEHFRMEITPESTVKITWKGVELTPPGGLPTTFAPRVGRIVFAGRTGGSWSVMHVDNIKLVTQPFTSAAVSGFQANAGGFTVQIQDQGTTTLDPSTISLKLNGSSVTPTAVTKSGAITYVRYTSSPLLAVGSTNAVDIGYKDNFGVASSASRTFIVSSYATLLPQYAVAAGAVDTAGSGFRVRMTQISAGRGPGDANTIANAERQLANGFTDPDTGQPYPNLVPRGPNSDGTYSVNVVNWNEYPTSVGGADAGNFKDGGTPPLDLADDTIPGIDGGPDVSDPTQPGYNDNIASEATAYLDLAAGYYTFGVNSDDGFRVSAGRGAADVLGVTLGSFNGGRGQSDTLFDVYVPTNGIYPIRLTWWEGGGGAEAEFFYVNQTTGEKRLINDRRDTANQIKAYPNATATLPYVSRARPESGQLFIFADNDLQVDITDGSVSINSSPITLALNGVQVPVTPVKSGAVTTVKRTGSLANLLPPGNNTATLTYSYTMQGNQVSVTNSWTFSVVPYAVIPAANAVSSVNQGTPGFLAKVNQIDHSGDANQGNGGRLPTGDQNRMPRPEIQLANGNWDPTNNAAYPNLADLGGATGGIYTVGDVINFNSPSGNSGIFADDTPLPGLPGTGTSNAGNDNYIAEFATYLNLKAGAYVMAVNSDDGFLAISGPDPHDTLGTLLGYANVGRGNATSLPAPGDTNSFIPTPGTSQNNFAFGVVVPQDGYYPFRLLYWQGGGGVNVEFLSIDKASGRQALVNNTSVPWAIKAFSGYNGPARPWVKFSVAPTPWDNRIQQAGPGPIVAVGSTKNSITSDDIANFQDNDRPWADVRIGGVIANGAGDSTLGLMLDGARVAASFATNGSDVTVSFKPVPPLPSGSPHTASLIYGGTTNSWSFNVQSYTNLQAADALPLNAADTSAAGFRVKVFQATSSQANTVARAEAQIAGAIPSVAVPGPNSDGSYTSSGIINWNNNLNSTNAGGLPVSANGTPIGNFQDNTYGPGWPFGDHPDDPVPGLPGTGLVNCDNSAAEVFTYLKFDTAGYYRFGVNSDDGFGLKVGTPGQTNGTVIIALDAGRGASDTPFSFTVPQPGLYPIRLIWYNGGGGANLEFFSYDDNGNKVPINDSANPASIKAFYRVSSVTQLRFTSVKVSGQNVVITWSGTGRLQQAANLTANAADWSDVVPAPTGSTFTVPIDPNGHKFYRLVSP
jgi:hypothetical protein